ncbi:MAG: peptide MFS transporter [Alphaproteobacteria bacterium]|nr:peptide MFS transporter [Alphaproteobacteria bacterium]MBU0864306.1 peptide MFS transporter [Alphaproteobacteria bacterium]MBU1825033.1 peptide MFS transporter [Alphaproteobacteria bacterium]
MADDGKQIFGHPRGLAYIVFTETWERFSFYGMQALLVLYMTLHLFQPENSVQVLGFEGYRAAMANVFGSLSPQALAAQTFGLYVGFVYFMPVFGGLLGDRYLGRKKSVIIGAVFMAFGHFLMAFEAYFLFALLALVVGSGFLKGNLAAQVGYLYAVNDKRRDEGFSVYVFGINVGAFVAPLICGTLGELYGWHYGFGAAGIGMLIGLAIYLLGGRYLPPERNRADTTERVRLQPGDGAKITGILAMLAITALYWTAQSQVWNSYPLWIKDQVDRDLGFAMVPVTWFQSLDSLAVLLLAPAVLWLWKRQSRRAAEPADLTKIGLGCAVFAAACLLLSVGEFMAGSGKVAILWPVLFHFVCAVGFLYLGPIALALTSRAAPAAVNAMMVSCYYLAIFAGSFASGWLGRFYETMAPAAFWAMHGAVVGSGALLILLFGRPLLRAMALQPQIDGDTP